MKRILSNIVLFASGVDVDFLNQNSPGEKGKYYPIGLGVIVTTLLGFISMMFATHSIFETSSFWEEIPLFLFSVFWGFAIFTIDWGLVKTMKKLANPSWKNRIVSFFAVLFRLAVAVILSYTISKPMEVKVYEKRLTAQIEKDRQEFVKREWKERNENIKTLDGSISDIMTKSAETIEKQNAGPKTTSYTMNVEELKKCRSQLEILATKNNSEINKLNSERSSIYNSANSYETYYVIEDSIQVSKTRMRRWAINRRNLIKNTLIPNLDKEVKDKKNDCNTLAGIITVEETAHKDSYADLNENISGQLDERNSEKQTRKLQDSLALVEIKKASFVSFDPNHPGLITQLESMSNFEETPEGKSASLVRLLLLLVIIAIDTAPIVIKLLTKRTVYDALKETEKDKLLFLSNHENIANRHLVTELSLAQRNVLDEAIKKWKEEELRDENLNNKYINNE